MLSQKPSFSCDGVFEARYNFGIQIVKLKTETEENPQGWVEIEKS